MFAFSLLWLNNILSKSCIGIPKRACWSNALEYPLLIISPSTNSLMWTVEISFSPESLTFCSTISTISSIVDSDKLVSTSSECFILFLSQQNLVSLEGVITYNSSIIT